MASMPAGANNPPAPDPVGQNRQDINELYLMMADVIGGAV